MNTRYEQVANGDATPPVSAAAAATTRMKLARSSMHALPPKKFNTRTPRRRTHTHVHPYRTNYLSTHAHTAHTHASETSKHVTRAYRGNAGVGGSNGGAASPSRDASTPRDGDVSAAVASASRVLGAGLRASRRQRRAVRDSWINAGSRGLHLRGDSCDDGAATWLAARREVLQCDHVRAQWSRAHTHEKHTRVCMCVCVSSVHGIFALR